MLFTGIWELIHVQIVRYKIKIDRYTSEGEVIPDENIKIERTQGEDGIDGVLITINFLERYLNKIQFRL